MSLDKRYASSCDFLTWGQFSQVLGTAPMKALEAKLMYSMFVKMLQAGGKGPESVLFSKFRYLSVCSVKRMHMVKSCMIPMGNGKVQVIQWSRNQQHASGYDLFALHKWRRRNSLDNRLNNRNTRAQVCS